MVNQALIELKVVQHPDKTYIGRIAHGFVFLGYEIHATGLTGVAPIRILTGYPYKTGHPRRIKIACRVQFRFG